jgi:hypothetical protein
VPELNDTADITERSSQARKLFGSMKKPILSNKQIPIDIRRSLYQATIANSALWGCESWLPLKKQTGPNWKPFTMAVSGDVQVDDVDVVEKRISNEPTMESMMEVRRYRWLFKLNAIQASRSSRRMLGTWFPTPRAVARPQQTIRHAYISTLKKLGFQEDKGQLRELMTVARDRPTWRWKWKTS